MNKFAMIAVLSLVPLLGGEATESADKKMNRAQEQLSTEAVMQIGMPAIVNFQENRMAKSILEARDKTIATTTYIVAENSGQLFKLCDSIGYGLPYATQFTSPMRPARYEETGPHGEVYALPQADPNGLFSPAQADATWIFCLDPETKKDKPVYVEPKVIVSPFPIVLTPVAFGK